MAQRRASTAHHSAARSQESDERVRVGAGLQEVKRALGEAEEAHSTLHEKERYFLNQVPHTQTHTHTPTHTHRGPGFPTPDVGREAKTMRPACRRTISLVRAGA